MLSPHDTLSLTLLLSCTSISCVSAAYSYHTFYVSTGPVFKKFFEASVSDSKSSRTSVWNPHEDFITAFKVTGGRGRGLFVSSDETEAQLRLLLSDGFEMDLKNFAHKVELLKIVSVWATAKVLAETKTKVDAVSRAHGGPTPMLDAFLRAFKDKYGKNMHESELLDQSYIEADEESSKCHAHTGGHYARWTASRTLGLNLNSTLSIPDQAQVPHFRASDFRGPAK